MRKPKVASPEALIRVGTASHMTRLSTQHLYRLARAGKLDVVTVDQMFFFRRGQVEQLARERERSVAHAS